VDPRIDLTGKRESFKSLGEKPGPFEDFFLDKFWKWSIMVGIEQSWIWKRFLLKISPESD
jgi:hypothetical protein